MGGGEVFIVLWSPVKGDSCCMQTVGKLSGSHHQNTCSSIPSICGKVSCALACLVMTYSLTLRAAKRTLGSQSTANTCQIPEHIGWCPVRKIETSSEVTSREVVRHRYEIVVRAGETKDGDDIRQC